MDFPSLGQWLNPMDHSPLNGRGDLPPIELPPSRNTEFGLALV